MALLPYAELLQSFRNSRRHARNPHAPPLFCLCREGRERKRTFCSATHNTNSHHPPPSFTFIPRLTSMNSPLLFHSPTPTGTSCSPSQSVPLPPNTAASDGSSSTTTTTSNGTEDGVTGPLDFTIPNIAAHGEKGLGGVPKQVLEQCLQPVLRGLQNMDAKALLEMKEVPHGARLRQGVAVEGIHNNIEPRQQEGTVRYIHVTEVPGQFSMGIFVFPPHGRIPLHDHPEMCVLSRVLYGDLDRLSLDLVNEDEIARTTQQHPTSPTSSVLKSAWNACRFRTATVPPKGAKRAFRNRVDHLVAPACTALYPYEGNLHEFVAGPYGAAVLDILLPPYDGKDGRDCTFYHIREDNSMESIQGRQPCWIVPTGQPEDFHCISGWYGGLGVPGEDDSEESMEDHDESDMMMLM